jgi:O-antigen/teichoic acid export membrane protein
MVGICAASGVIAFVILVGGEKLWTATILPGLTTEILVLVAATTPVLVYIQISSALLAGLGRVPLLALVRTISALVAPGVSLLLLWWHSTPFFAVLAWTVVSIASACAMGVLAVRAGAGLQSAARADVRRVLGFGLKAQVGTLAHYGFLRLDVLFISGFLGTASVGYYSLASQLAERLTLATSALYNASAAQIGGSARSVAAKLTTRVVRLTLLVLLPVTVLVGVLGTFMIPLLYGDEFRASVTPFILLLPGVLCLAVWYIVGLFLIANFKRPGLTTRIQLVGLVASVPLYLIVVNLFEMNGAAAASSAIYLFIALLGCLSFRRITGLPLSSFLPRPADLRYTWGRAVGEMRTLRGKRARAT